MPKMVGKVGDKAKDFKGSLKNLLIYTKKYYFIMLVVMLMVVFSTVCRLIGPNKLGEITNIINPTTNITFDINLVIKIAIALIILYVLSFIANYVSNILMGRVTFLVTKNLRSDISVKINKLPLKYLDSTPYGDVLSRITNDVDVIGQTLMNSVSSFVGAVVMFVGSLLMMFITNWIMALSAIFSTIFGFVIMRLIVGKSQKYFVKQQRSLGELNGIIEESYSGQSVIKIYNASQETKDKFDKVNRSLKFSASKSQFLSGIMQPLMGFIGNFGYVVVCIVGAVLVINGNIQFGVIVSFMIYVRLFTQPLSQIAQTVTNLQTAAAASERVFEFLNEEELTDESNKTITLESVKGNVEFKSVSFGYDANKEIIHNFSASIKAGQKIAIVGPTGAGKTTIVNLLMRFYELSSGDITIDGVSIKSITRENLRKKFSMVLQDTWLFEGTVRENLVYNKTGVTDEEIWNACDAVEVDHFIKTLPNGLDSKISDMAVISSGQKQLFTIARAMIQNSPILILDEATSNVDTRTEELIQKAMDKLMEGRTSFVIAHRLSTIKNADMILVLNNGDIVEQGTHKELIKLNGFYASLYNSQFSE